MLSRDNPPLEVRKASRMLGLDPNLLTRESVLQSWKSKIIDACYGSGEIELAIELNVAKDTLYKWIDDQQENGLGSSSVIPRRPRPRAGSVLRQPHD